ncbi:MAG: hypothetical protein IKU59_06040 [Bacteroidales bacterium]|nr:hypothetical protein [Bacteroidales bacterium]
MKEPFFAEEVEKMFDEATKKASIIASATSGSKNSFELSKEPAAKKRIDEVILQLNEDLSATIINGDKEEWLLSANKNDAMVDYLAQHTNLPSETISQWKSRNLDALEAFQHRKIEGMNLSTKVWNITDQFKGELEMAIDVALGDGTSANKLSQTVRNLLNNPNALFRRVRDKHGQLRLSQNAKNYHPGQGVYRSAYRNALRLTATETNMAYRTADHTRWQQLNFVTGIEIKLSNNHNCRGIAKGQFYDICDELAGVYPKDFKFVGWHPFCRCFAIPKLADMNEFLEYQDKFVAGQDVSNYKFSGEVTQMPKQFNEWVENNKERAKGWASMPYFVRQNPKYIKGFEVDTYSKAERKFTRARKTKEAMLESMEIYLKDKYPNIPNTEKAAIYHYTKGDGAAFRRLNNQLRKGKLNEFNEAFSELLSKGLEKLPTTTKPVYRTIRLNKTNLNKYITLSNDKAITIFEGFTSTSLDKEITLNFAQSKRVAKKNETDILLVIQGKSGHPIEDLSQFSGRFEGKANQKEVLFNKGLKVRFDRVEIKDERYIFYLSEI